MGIFCNLLPGLLVALVLSPNAKMLAQQSCSGNSKKHSFCIDETKVQTCENGMKKEQYQCSNLRPFCDGGTCGLSVQFFCPDVKLGYFPDLNGCNKFHICFNGTLTSHRCDGATVYSSKLKSCARLSNEHQCLKFDCVGRKDGQGVPYSGDPTIYAICRSNKPFTIKKCPGEESFKAATKRCEYTCFQEGNMRNLDDCHSYYSCIRTGFNNYIMKPMTCPNGTWFNPDALFCTEDVGLC